MVSILTKFRNKPLLVVSKLLKTGLREEFSFVRQMKVTALIIGLWNWKSTLVVCKARGFLCAFKTPSNPFDFMFCWPESRYIHLKKNNFDAQFIFSVFPKRTLHVPGLSIANHQEAQPYVYNNWYSL